MAAGMANTAAIGQKILTPPPPPWECPLHPLANAGTTDVADRRLAIHGPTSTRQQRRSRSGWPGKQRLHSFLDPADTGYRDIYRKENKAKGLYKNLVTIPGIGRILELTIMLETGPIARFVKVGNYASYCRTVSSKWTSNDKARGKGNKKNGNKYLSWAFSEAAELARRYNEQARAYYNRKLQQTNFMSAHAALAHKLARAAYYIMRDQVAFMPEKTFT